jgi:small subunit ribosomal protein S16
MLIIRLQRVGRKHEPTFRVVLTDSKNGPKSGKYLKNLGWYDTRRKNTLDQMDTEEIKRWISQGAQTSVTMHNFLVHNKVIAGKKINALPKKKPIKKEDVNKEEASKAEAKADSPATEKPSAASIKSENPAPESTSAPVPAEKAAA